MATLDTEDLTELLRIVALTAVNIVRPEYETTVSHVVFADLNTDDYFIEAALQSDMPVEARLFLRWLLKLGAENYGY